MKSRIILAAAVAGALGCSHDKNGERDTKDEGTEAPPRTRKTEQPQTKKEKEDEATTRPPAEEGRPELTTSPQGLLLPEGPRLIQEALAERGFLAKDHRTGELDAPTSAALRKFQEKEELARTGSPDRETVRRLGLSIDEVFKATGEGNDDPERKR